MDPVSYIQVDGNGVRFSWAVIFVAAIFLFAFIYYYYYRDYSDDVIDPVPIDKINADGIKKNGVVFADVAD